METASLPSGEAAHALGHERPRSPVSLSLSTPVKVRTLHPAADPAPMTPATHTPAPEKFIILPRNAATVTTTTTTTTTTQSDGTQQQVTISSPMLKYTRAHRGSRPLSRENSKELLQTAGALSFGGVHESTASLTTTSIIHTPSLALQPHPPGTASPTPSSHATLISTTTSYTLDDALAAACTKLPAVSQSSPTPSLTASLLATNAAAAAKDASQLSLPALVTAHQSRIAQLEATTVSQAESILELRQIVRNLQRQLVMVMASVPSTSGTGNLIDLAAAPAPAVHRSRSNTELRYARAQKRLSGGSTPRTPRTPTAAALHADGLVHHLHHGAHTSSMDSLPGATNAHAPRTVQSRPTSRYGSPRNQAQSQLQPPQPQQQSGAKAASGSSHHFSFHPHISTLPPPGQIMVEPVQALGTRTPGGRSRRFIQTTTQHTPSAGHHSQDAPSAHHSPLHPQQQQQHSQQGQPHYQYPASTYLPSRRLTPVEFTLGSPPLGRDEPASANLTFSPSYPPAASGTAYPYQQVQAGAFSSSESGGPSAAPMASLDNIRPLPVQHTVTHGKHGVTEYVLSFRDGEQQTPDGLTEEQYQQQFAYEQWRAQQQAALGGGSAGAHTKKEKKEKKDGKKKSRRDKDALGQDEESLEDAAAAAEERRAAKKAAKGESKKPCRVAGCTEPRTGHEKYCKAHGGPAPINPNARKMMFQH